MLGVPGRPVRIHLWIRRQIEQKHDNLDRAPAGRHDLHVEVASVPVSQGFADVDSVAHAGGEFLRACQVRPQDGLCLFADVAMEALDPVVFGRVRAHPERIPALTPARLIGFLRLRPQFAGPPRKRMAGQSADHRPGAPDGQLALVESQPRVSWLVRVKAVGFARLCRETRIGTSRLGKCQREVVAGSLFGRDDQRVKIRRQAPVNQRKIPDVAEIDRQKLRGDPLGDPGVLLAQLRARRAPSP